MNKRIKSIRIKLIHRIIWIALVCLTITVIISFAFLSPVMANQTLQKCEQATKQMLSVLDTSFNSIASYTNTIIFSNDLETAILACIKNPESASYASKLELTLHGYLSKTTSIRGIILELPNGNFVNSITGIYAEDLKLIDSPWYMDRSDSLLSKRFSNFYTIRSTRTAQPELTCAYNVNFPIKTNNLRLTVFLTHLT